VYRKKSKIRFELRHKALGLVQVARADASTGSNGNVFVTASEPPRILLAAPELWNETESRLREVFDGLLKLHARPSPIEGTLDRKLKECRREGRLTRLHESALEENLSRDDELESDLSDEEPEIDDDKEPEEILQD
jgi:hypothetical protein